MFKNLKRKALSLVLLFTPLAISQKTSAMREVYYKYSDWLSANERNSFSVDRRKDVETSDDTPLNQAVAEGNMSRVSELLQGYPAENVNGKGKKGNTALHFAYLKLNRDIIRLLLTLGADPSVLNEKGLSPIHVAVLKNHILFLKELFCIAREKGLNNGVNTLTTSGKTPLMLAAEVGYEETARVLLENGAETNIIFWPKKRSLVCSGYTALDLAHKSKEKNNNKLIELLIEYGAMGSGPYQHSKLKPLQLQSISASKSTGNSAAVQRKKKAREKKAALASSLSTGNLAAGVGLVNSAEMHLKALSLSQD